MKLVNARPSLISSSLAVALALASLTSHASAQEAEAPPSEEVDGLRITEMVLAHGVENGEAVGPATTFTTADGRVMVLIRLENTTGAETDLRVSFERADREVTAGTATGGAGVTLHLPARPRTRTVARTGTRAAGRYRVVVRTSAGNVLGTAEYEITAAS